LVTAGCYNYNPLTDPQPGAGSYVAVTLTDSGSQELARYLGPNVFVSADAISATAIVASSSPWSSVELKRGQPAVVGRGDGSAAERHHRVARCAAGSPRDGASCLAAWRGGLVAATLAFTLNGGGTPLGPGRPPQPAVTAA